MYFATFLKNVSKCLVLYIGRYLFEDLLEPIITICNEFCDFAFFRKGTLFLMSSDYVCVDVY